MKRIVDYYLQKWKASPVRQPLLLHGARQIGKTYAARQLGKTYVDFVEVNLEMLEGAHKVFEKDLDPETILTGIAALTRKKVKPGKTLLFIDEIQAVPRAIKSLRYFYEMMPELHVIAAGSLLDFALEAHGAPVGRVQSLYMYPMSFMEFLVGIGEEILAEQVVTLSVEKEVPEVVHSTLLELLGQYFALGGMPKVVECWRTKKDPYLCADMHSSIITFYRQDFGKYSRTHQVKYVKALFDAIPNQLGGRFRYSKVEGSFRKRELAPALDLLTAASVAQKVYRTSGSGLPLAALADLSDYKVLLLDVGLTQSIMDLGLTDWFLDPVQHLISKGSITEAFIGQELLAYGDPIKQKNLYYWRRIKQGIAEVDYLMQMGSKVIPIEVKGGPGTTLRSLHSFLKSYEAPYGIRFSTQNTSVFERVHSYPLYAVSRVASQAYPQMNDALKSLFT